MSQKNTPEIRMVPVGQLTEHPLLERLPYMPEGNEHEGDPERRKDGELPKAFPGTNWEAFAANIREYGVKEPLLITEKGEVLDGRRRLAAARALLEEPEVPCIVVPDDDTHEAILRSICHRRHLTKSALAYLAYPIVEEALEAARKRRTECLKRGDEIPVGKSLPYGKTVEDIAADIGVSRKYINHAAKLHEAWRTGKIRMNNGAPRQIAHLEIERARVEDGLFCKGHSLPGLVQGFGGKESTNGGAPQEGDTKRQLELFGNLFETASKRWRYWNNFNESEREQALKKAETMIDAMPEDLRARLIQKMQAMPKGAF